MRENPLVRRAVAALIDLAAFIALTALVFRFFGREVHREGYTFYLLNGFPAGFLAAIWVFHYPFTESCFGKTLGKFLCGISVISTRKTDLTFWQLLLRRLLDPLEVWFAFGLIGLLVAGLSEDGRRLGDKLGDTRVVRDQAG